MQNNANQVSTINIGTNLIYKADRTEKNVELYDTCRKIMQNVENFFFDEFLNYLPLELYYDFEANVYIIYQYN